LLCCSMRLLSLNLSFKRLPRVFGQRVVGDDNGNTQGE
jgi:hypothetical protein